MFVPLFTAVLLGIPALLLSVGYGALAYRAYRRGGSSALLRIWAGVVSVLAAIGVGVVLLIGLHNGRDSLYNGLAVFTLLFCLGGLPTAAASLVIRRLAQTAPEQDRFTVSIATLAALGMAVPGLLLAVWVGRAFWL